MAVAKTHNIENLITTIDISNSDNYTLRLEQREKDCIFRRLQLFRNKNVVTNEHIRK